MRASRILCVLAAVVLPQLAAAEDHGQQGQISISPQALGIVEAVLNYCSEVDPRDAATFQAERKNLLGGASGDAAEDLRGSSAYRESYHLISDALKGLAKGQAAQTCAAGAKS